MQTNYTSIHWHGMNQRGTPYYDGLVVHTQCPIPPLTNMQYTFRADPRGSSFWHAHFEDEASDGIYGGLIVNDPPGSFPFHYDEEMVIMLTDAFNLFSWQETLVFLSQAVGYLSKGEQIPDLAPDQSFLCVYDETTTPPTPSCSSTTDGRGFSVTFQPGKTYRLRIICSSEIGPFLFSIDEHELQAVTTDFSILDGSAWVQSVPLMTGQRYDVLVRAKDNVPDGTQFWARATSQPQCVAVAPNNATTDIRGVITYGCKNSSTLPTSISWNATNPNCTDLSAPMLKPFTNTSWSQLDPAMTMFFNYTFPTFVNNTIVLEVNGNVYNASDFAYPTLFNYNENPWWKPTVPGEQRNLFVIPDSMLGKEIRVILYSLPAFDGRNHPFHRHGGGFKVLAIGTSSVTQADLDMITTYNVLTAVQRDTVVVPKDGWVAIQFTADNPGVWSLHCHIGFHFVNGMLGQLVIAPNAIAQMTIPPELKSMCTPV